jgi:predicted MPP superfamily phosphohydrolase
MKSLLRSAAFVAGAVGASLLAYGAFVESRNLVLERRSIRLRRWPKRLDGFRIGVMSDLHLWSRRSEVLGREAVSMLLDEAPDMVAIAGDFVEVWGPHLPRAIGDLLEPLLVMEGNVVAVPGNHDYKKGPPDPLERILGELNIKLLRNQSWKHQGITWVGVDSVNVEMADLSRAFADVEQEPVVVLWHEPDLNWALPRPCALQISGHGHGGQFVLPGGIVPMHTRNGKRYPGGYYPDAETPLFVSRGVGTTFLPSRFLCPPEVTILTLYSDEEAESS